MIRRGSGMAAACYPTGMQDGANDSQAVVRLTSNGSVDLIIGSVDTGAGVKTILAQMAAEELGVPADSVNVILQGSDAGALCLGTFASRVMFYAGSAVAAAARSARQQRDAALPGWKVIIGRGRYQSGGAPPDPFAGRVTPFSALAWAGVHVSVAVDDETGKVTLTRLASVVDVGRAVNPARLREQIAADALAGLRRALPGLAAPPPEAVITQLYECPSSSDAYGAKHISEICGNAAAPALVNALYDALGVWFVELPIPSAAILDALKTSPPMSTR